MNTQKFKDNGLNKFPISTDTLNFIQEQIKLVYGLASLAGVNMIIKQSTSSTDGLIVVDGELMPLTGSPLTHIYVVETPSNIVFNGQTITGARTIRYATYTNATGTLATSFTTVKSLKTLSDELAAALQHHTPKGTVIDWYGEASCDNIPYGWVPCGGYAFGSESYNPSATPTSISQECNKWSIKYPGCTVTSSYNGAYYVQVTNISGFGDIPNLNGHIIIGAGRSGTYGTYEMARQTGYVEKVAASSGNYPIYALYKLIKVI